MKIKIEKHRNLIQFVWMFITNSYLVAFLKGGIYKGKLKSVCVPGLNCYSCPSAMGSCPVGALQSQLAGVNKIPFYSVGFLIFFGALVGRFICGFLCPFGFIQDLLIKIPFINKIQEFKGDKILRYIKYLILIVFVILLPLFVLDSLGLGETWFCKYICPAGTLEAGIPLSIFNEGIASLIGFLFFWKFIILLFVLGASVVIYRPFCKYLCPLGAFYGLFNKISIFAMSVDNKACIGCGTCKKVCPMGCNMVEDSNNPECIRCGKCKLTCPVEAINCGLEVAIKKTHE